MSDRPLRDVIAQALRPWDDINDGSTGWSTTREDADSILSALSEADIDTRLQLARDLVSEAGYVVVPREPTLEMIWAAADEVRRRHRFPLGVKVGQLMEAGYRAALVAGTTTPRTGG